MPQLRKRNGKYWQLEWFGPDIDPATGKKARHQESLGRIDEVPEKLARDRLKVLTRELFMVENGLKSADVMTPTFASYRDEYLGWHSLEYPDSHYRTKQILEQHVPRNSS
jgi:hypothetical protein